LYYCTNKLHTLTTNPDNHPFDNFPNHQCAIVFRLFALDPVVVHFSSIEAPRRRRQPPRARLFAIGVDHGTTTPTEYTICPLAWQHLFVPAANFLFVCLFVCLLVCLFVCLFFFLFWR
jgi:hypothetical protein